MISNAKAFDDEGTADFDDDDMPLKQGSAHSSSQKSTRTSGASKATSTTSHTASQEQIDELTEQLKRAQADFVNYRKRLERDQSLFVTMTYAEVLTQFLPILDNVQRVTQHVPAELEKNEWVRGVLNTEQQFTDVMKRIGVTPIPSVGEKVDPVLHEVLAIGPGPRDEVTEEIERGYLFRERVLRPAKVRVGDGTT